METNISKLLSTINQSLFITYGVLKENVFFDLFNLNSEVSCGFVSVWSIIVLVFLAIESNKSSILFLGSIYLNPYLETKF